MAPIRRASSAALPIAAAGLYLAWTFLTWLLEKRIGTFLRPEAVTDRLVYTLVANVLVSTILAMAALRWSGVGQEEIEAAGFGSPGRRWAWIPGALVTGGLGFALLRPAGLAPMTILNLYAQVLPVTIAEILVCWSLPAATIRASWSRGWLPKALLLVVGAILFGVYHFAHSAPFDSFPMVGFLTAVGLVTGAFFLLSRNAYATMLFHNFLGTLGTSQALAAGGRLGSLAEPAWPLLATAVAALAVLVLMHVVLVRLPQR